MTKKDYEAIARTIRGQVEQTVRDGLGYQLSSLLAVATDLEEHCQKNNPRFDRIKFMHACGFEWVRS